MNEQTEAEIRLVKGVVGWVIVLGAAAAWDIHPRTETMSAAFHPGKEQRPRPGLGYAGLWLYLTGHLFRLIPERWDPLRQLDIIKRKHTRTH